MKLCRAFMLTVFGAGFAVLAASPSAWAQSNYPGANYPGEGVEVYPPPPSERGADVLLYPGTNVVGVQGRLLQPGAPYPGTEATPIKLIPPDQLKKRKARTASQPPMQAQTTEAFVASTYVPPPAVEPKKKKAQPPVQQAVVAPDEPITLGASPQPQPAAAMPQPRAPQTAAASAKHVPFSLTPTSPDIVIGAHGRPRETFHNTAHAKPVPVQTRVASPLPAPPPAEAATLESSAPPPAAIAASLTPVSLTPKPDAHRGLSKRSEIVFPEGAVDPTPDTITDLRKLATDLTGALRGATRVQLEAFGGTPGDKSSDARRLSLKRALAVRALLIESGVPAERIDVRALGGITDGGTPDRVDVFVRAG